MHLPSHCLQGKACFWFVCLFLCRYTGTQHRQLRPPNTTRKQTINFKKQTVSGKEGTSQGGQNKWAPSCRTLNENEQGLKQVGDGQREGKNQIEIVCQLPKPHQAVVKTLAESKL